MHVYLIVKKVYSHAKDKLYGHIKMYVYIPVEKVYLHAKKKSMCSLYKCTCICRCLFTREEKSISSYINARVFTSKERIFTREQKVYGHS